MKSNYISKTLILGSLVVSAYACSLDRDPISQFPIAATTTQDSIKYDTRDEMYSQYQALYQLLKDRQEHWYLDLMLVAEAHSDNAYAGTTGSEVVPMEKNTIDGGNSCMERDWNRYLADVAQANAVIVNIDAVPDATLTATERKQWKAEAKIFRAMIWFDMVRLWGNIPVVTKEAPNITAANITEVYPLYYPVQSTPEEAYAQIIKDLEEGMVDAPANNAADKTMLSKSVAKALLAKVYAEKPVRDYNKVLDYSNQVLADGFTLVTDYSDLFGMDAAGTDAKARSTSESILEVNYFTGGGNWVTWMFGRDLTNYETSFTWAKWVTPSRDLINAFNAEGDNIRLNQSVVYYETTWSNYYPSTNYAFMYKCRSGVSSILKYRLADIILLKAEALANLGGTDNLTQAGLLVNQIRNRVKLANLTSAAYASKESMLDAVLHERRLELAFECQRWFDLVRYGKVAEVMNNLNSRDSGRLPLVRPYSAESDLMPVPQTVLDLNSNLVQNPGY